jgi:hypothetical protein
MSEEQLLKIDEISKIGLPVMCMQKHDEIKQKYNSYRLYLQHINDEPKFYFNENKIYYVTNIINEYIYIDSFPFSVIEKENCPYIFDYFRLLTKEELNNIPNNSSQSIDNMINTIMNYFYAPNKSVDYINVKVFNERGEQLSESPKEYNLDDILDKIHKNGGINSLTKEEREFLESQH